MPTYTFYHGPSDILWDEIMSTAEREQYLKDNPEISQIAQSNARPFPGGIKASSIKMKDKFFER